MNYQADVVVVGAGLTGLTTAHYLNKSGVDFLIIEKNDVAGGAIQTEMAGEFTYEKGPSTGVMSNETVQELFNDLSAFCTLERAADSVNKRYVLKSGSWHALPSGLMTGIATPLFTLKDKLRLLGEPFRKAGTDPNETLAQLVKRRMGDSFLDYAIDPFILGVYAGDPNLLVPRFALPKLYNLEQKYGSFMGGAIKMGREKRCDANQKKEKKSGNRIFSVRGGLSQLIAALVKSIGEERLIPGIRDLVVVPDGDGYLVEGLRRDGLPVTVKAKKVISTVGAHELSALLPFVPNDQISRITNLLYARVVQVAIGFSRWDGLPLDAFGGLIPFSEKRDILGVLFPSAFLSQRAPQGGAMLSVFMGGVRRPDIFDQTDSQIREMVEREVCDLMQLKNFNPTVFKIFRYREAIPQYGADCESRFSVVEKLQRDYPGLIIGGNLRNGIGMADRILQGKTMATSVL